MPDALIMVDIQRDFLPGGALAVPRGDEQQAFTRGSTEDDQSVLALSRAGRPQVGGDSPSSFLYSKLRARVERSKRGGANDTTLSAGAKQRSSA